MYGPIVSSPVYGPTRAQSRRPCTDQQSRRFVRINSLVVSVWTNSLVARVRPTRTQSRRPCTDQQSRRFVRINSLVVSVWTNSLVARVRTNKSTVSSPVYGPTRAQSCRPCTDQQSRRPCTDQQSRREHNLAVRVRTNLFMYGWARSVLASVRSV